MDEVLGNKTSVNEADFEKLEYIEQVLKETLRLHAPFFASFPKETLPEGMTLNGYHIPGGTQVMVGIISILFSRLLKKTLSLMNNAVAMVPFIPDVTAAIIL